MGAVVLTDMVGMSGAVVCSIDTVMCINCNFIETDKNIKFICLLSKITFGYFTESLGR